MTDKKAVKVIMEALNEGDILGDVRLTNERVEAFKLAAKALERLQGKCRTCRHRDPEDKKCECGGLERQGCPFPVSDDYFCKFYEKGGTEI